LAGLVLEQRALEGSLARARALLEGDQLAATIAALGQQIAEHGPALLVAGIAAQRSLELSPGHAACIAGRPGSHYIRRRAIRRRAIRRRAIRRPAATAPATRRPGCSWSWRSWRSARGRGSAPGSSAAAAGRSP